MGNYGLILCCILSIMGLSHFVSHLPVHYSSGIAVNEDPVQSNLYGPQNFNFKGWDIQRLANFTVKAKVLSTKEYGWVERVVDRGAEISPIDFALGWGQMSDQAVVDKFKISQNNRFYYWEVPEYPIPRDEIISHSANMHLIPANAAIESTLKSVRIGEVVQLKGFLVNVSKDNGIWSWRTSMSRNDSGNGACELVYVESVNILHPF
ncbi:MAG: hypothetical protein K2X66_08475 [Cyanobacteria bacterium]|nr:hypothetical protein [Cyanobacteriota bacterium]